MISFLNRKLRGFLFLILILVAAAFIFIDVPSTGLTGTRNLGEIRGEAISRADFAKYFRETELSFTLTTGQMISQYPGMQDMLARETWNRLITLKAAEDAGISVSADEVTDYVTLHPIFQQDGKFNPERFQQFAAAFFDPPGVTIADGMNLERFESAVRHQLMIEKFNRMIQSSAVTTDKEVTSLIHRLHGSSTIKVATLSRQDVAKAIKIDETELEAFYQQNINRYMTQEERQIDYVYFQLPSNTPESGEKREALLRQLGETAFKFSGPFYDALQDQTPLPNFAGEAKAANLEVKQSDFFTVSGKPSGIPGGEKVTNVAYSLSQEEPVSDAIQVQDGFVVIHLANIKSSEPIPFAQAAETVRQDYREREIERKLSIDGRQMAMQLSKLLEAGTEWDAALAEVGFKAGKDITLIPSIQMRNSDQGEVTQLAARSASAMEVKETSPFERQGDTGYVFYVSQRTPPAAEIVENNRQATQQQLVAQQGAMLVREWVKSQYNAPGTELPMLDTQNL